MEKNYTCECGKVFEKAQSINAHYSHCIIHRKGKPGVGNRGGSGWSKGLSKDTHKGIAKMAKTLSKVMKGRTGYHHTDEQRKNLSLKRIAFLESHPDCNIKWHSVSNGSRQIKVQGEWEKNVAEWLNANEIRWDRKRICYDGTHHYTPDFWLTELNVYVEVKGWMSNRDLKKMKNVVEHTGITILLLDKELYERIETLKLEDLKAEWRNW